MKVYPIGSEQDPSGRRVEEIMQNPDMLLIDCRIHPWSWRTTWQKDALAKQWGTRYHTAGAFLGNAKHPSNRMFPGKCEIELVNPDVGIKGLMRYLSEGYDLILLCACLDYHYCHLSEVVRRLTDQMPDLRVMLPESDPTPAYKYANGAKVYVKMGGQKIPAVVLESRWSQEGDYDQCRLRIAQQDGFSGKWYVAELPRPVQSYKLSRRPTTIPELDDVEEGRHANS